MTASDTPTTVTVGLTRRVIEALGWKDGVTATSTDQLWEEIRKAFDEAPIRKAGSHSYVRTLSLSIAAAADLFSFLHELAGDRKGDPKRSYGIIADRIRESLGSELRVTEVVVGESTHPELLGDFEVVDVTHTEIPDGIEDASPAELGADVPSSPEPEVWADPKLPVEEDYRGLCIAEGCLEEKEAHSDFCSEHLVATPVTAE